MQPKLQDSIKQQDLDRFGAQQLLERGEIPKDADLENLFTDALQVQTVQYQPKLFGETSVRERSFAEKQKSYIRFADEEDQIEIESAERIMKSRMKLEKMTESIDVKL